MTFARGLNERIREGREIEHAEAMRPVVMRLTNSLSNVMAELRTPGRVLNPQTAREAVEVLRVYSKILSAD